MTMKIGFLFVFLTAMPLQAAKKFTAPELLQLDRANKPEIKDAILSTFTNEAALQKGTAFAFRGGDFFFALSAETAPTLIVDDGPPLPMKKLADTKLWYAGWHTEKVSFDHSFHYVVNGANFGGAYDLPALGPLSYVQPGVPSGTLSGELTNVSKVYDGMVSHYWLYIPAQYDPKVQAALMVFQDGASYLDRNGVHPALNVIDNLIAMKKIPVMVCLFIDPGDISKSPGTPTYLLVQHIMKEFNRTMKDGMRSVEYDTVSDRYGSFLHDDVLPEVNKQYNIRQDGYSRGTTGISSGGIVAFNTAWQNPGDFSRVISWVGSFGARQWKEVPENPDGGQDYPEKILRETHRNIRVYLADGSNDLEFGEGSWPLNAIRMANALKLRNYDFHFSFGTGAHSPAFGATQFPEEMMWLWRDYDPAKTSQAYEIEPSEKAKPLFRVSITNRDAK